MEDQQEKTEQATDYKLEQAKKKGNVARSADMLSFLVLAVFLICFTLFSGDIAQSVTLQTKWWLSHAHEMFQHNFSRISYTAEIGFGNLWTLFLPYIVMSIVVIVLSSVVYSGFVFTLSVLKPDFKRLDPIKGLKKIFSKRLFVEVIRVVLKGCIFFVVTYFAIVYLIKALFNHLSSAPQAIEFAFQHAFSVLVMSLLAIFGFFALFDIWYAKRDFAKQMRMSHKEIKDEYRNREGSPEIKSRRRRAQQEFLNKAKSIAQVKNADVIVVNPSHYAVALQYKPDKMQVPIVLATGTGSLAKLIRWIARKNSIPILHKPKVARFIYAKGVINKSIPSEMHDDVVDIYRWVLAIPNTKLKI